MRSDGEVSGEVRKLEQRDREESSQPREREQPPDEAAEERTPTLQQVMHRAEALACVEPPVDTPPTPINDTGKVEAMTRMGGDVQVFADIDVGEVIVNGGAARQVDEVLESMGAEILEER